jgi:hypothetical protein
MMRFICLHEPDCSKPDRYISIAWYHEIWSSEGLVEIKPSDTEPDCFFCTECEMPAQLEASETTKQNRKARAEESKQERMM